MRISGGKKQQSIGGMETIVGTCIFSFSLPLLFLISFEVVVFLVFSVPYYPHLSCPGLVLFFLQSVFVSLLLPSAARMGDNRRTQVCFFTQFLGV